MARDLQRKFEESADKKGLEGEERKRYIGGAWQHVRSPEHRSYWRYSRDQQLMERHFGQISSVHELKDKPGEIAFKQDGRTYHMSKGEYHELAMAALEDERREKLTDKQRAREDAREAREIERLLRKAHKENRESERRRLEAEATQKKRERREAQEAESEQRQLRTFERAQYSDVLDIIRHSGGIKRSISAASGQEYNRGEYEALPRSVRAKSDSRRGLTLDEAASEVSDQMPWLDIETPRDLLDFFDRARTYRYAHMRAA
jgi:hypothetical protein